MPKQRLDILLAERGLFASRSRAAASVMAGEVRVGLDRRKAAKPGELIEVDAAIAVDDGPAFVSRGGVKLANALGASGLDVRDRRALDAGASTGGFTDCLLQHGAAAVVAVDVGYGDLHWQLRTDSRVTVLERTNVRGLAPDDLPWAPEVLVADLSFISLEKVLPALLGAAAPRYDALLLVKPQFEVGRAGVGKGGVVRDGALRRAALIGVGRAAMALGSSVLAFYSSGLPGPKGNRESFIALAEAGRPGGAGGEAELEALAREIEP